MLSINSKRGRRILATTGVVGIGLSIPSLAAGTASAASVSTWDKVAQCESSGDWHINTGNGFYGGLQFTNSTWTSFGGGSYASRADLATKDQQIAIAEKVLAVQGPGAWPVCSVKAGLTKGGPAPEINPGGSASSTAPAASAAPKPAAPAAPAASTGSTASTGTSQDGMAWQGKKSWQGQWNHGATYTVRAGDWLSTIAERNHVQGGWQKLYEINKSVLKNGPHTIYPGQKLSLGTPAKASSTPAQAAPAAAKPATTAVKASTTTTTAQTATGSKAAAVNFALSKVGQAYIYGGTGNGGWDCSGLTQAALRAAGISVPRVAADQADYSTRVSLDNLQPGDLLFWSSNGANSGVHHVALYIGDGKYVEAANPSAGVRVQTIANWAPDFAGRV
ncbi:transglycosylase family protein [Kitasatospora sp. DSM 101779]|uniref:transglycosylase family protein n=1 Tax=Kitasatospora sp. DSM 101779 TaxID=2853165 RepID=UPI0021DA2287|nr:transglycosylase family protein [Kitasatospora sp. DSM 101779]MCU7825685.1 transglycosylase family protein [Kitasatospora sp. DSM 101779]